MDAIVFETPEGQCFVQPQHIVGAFADPDPKRKGKTIVSVASGQTFNFDAPPLEVWELLQKQIRDINLEKQRGVAEIVVAMSKQRPRGEMN